MRGTISVFLAACFLASGCASDPNKEVKQAQAAEARSDRERQENAIDQEKQASIKATEHENNVAQARAERLPDETDDRVSAQANMKAEREKYQADVTARLDKAQAKLQEAKRRMDIAGPKTPSDVRTRVDAAQKQHQFVAKEAQSVASAPNESWKTSTKSLDEHLDELDKLVDEAKSKTDKLKN